MTIPGLSIYEYIYQNWNRHYVQQIQSNNPLAPISRSVVVAATDCNNLKPLVVDDVTDKVSKLHGPFCFILAPVSDANHTSGLINVDLYKIPQKTSLCFLIKKSTKISSVRKFCSKPSNFKNSQKLENSLSSSAMTDLSCYEPML